ncbi:Primosome assembly protein PriA [Sulfurovum sp. enrichment culture clone C5]|uniref:Replication restart protein PriA n=1 Tax=Sulfurovum sp. enrichment culture clone C5 TaxID=497650 RepID=A0A0S4XPP9_9BACT|nr:Primosome assembly protein PriA [Sulfurovum sp. enrichment culture clone C5]
MLHCSYTPCNDFHTHIITFFGIISFIKTKELIIYYYQLALSKSSAPLLTYASETKFAIGTILKVPLKHTVKNAIILDEVQKPDFDTSDILEDTLLYYTPKQLEIAKFIAMYYFSTLSESLALFVPHKKSVSAGVCLECNSEQVQGDENPHPHPLPTLTQPQQNALNAITTHQKSLLFGVTGSGKTEIFIHLIADTLQSGKNVIFLMPEISLTPQMKKRLSKYFGENIALWHSKLTRNAKNKILDDINSGSIRIIAGARSALFTPLDNIGLIIVDEEHDDSYKAMTTPRYHARDVAVMIAEKLKSKVLLASATPSLNSFVNYPIIRLNEAYSKNDKIYKFIEGDSINNNIINAITQTLKNNEQAIVFLPTRGNFKYLHCPSCGNTHKCPFCSVGMALHRDNRRLRCHYCGYSEPIITKCTTCGYEPLSSNRIGTKEAVQVISENLPNAKIAQFDKDSITTPKKLTQLLDSLSKRETDILVGTQMISKGHDYPDITLSIIMGLDHILSLADFRAKERAISLMFQIAGRSGRDRDALVLIQTQHEDYFAPYLKDYELFIKDELEFRKTAFYPPYSRMARVIIENRDATKAKNLTILLSKKLREFDRVEIVGEGKTPIEKIANKYRYHIILKSHSQKELLKALHNINMLGIKIDMDAIDFS